MAFSTKMLLSGLGLIGETAKMGTKLTGSALSAAVNATEKVLPHTEMSIEDSAKHLGKAVLGAGDKVFNNKVYFKEAPDTMIGFQMGLTKSGKRLGAGMIMAGSMMSIADEETASWNGIQDNRIQTSTPSMREYTDPSYVSRGGADGSLVFALNRNRLG